MQTSAAIPAAAIPAAVIVAAIAFVALCASPARGEIVTKPIEYKAGDTTLEGFLVYDDAIAPGTKRPGVIVVHEWWGPGDYEKMRATMLARLGYVAFVADMFGKGRRTDDPQQAGAWAGEIGKNPELLRSRANAAIDVIRKQPQVDPAKIAAIGYCFGGGVVLDMARSGADLAGVVSFHGRFDTSTPAQKGQVKAQILACHGADDTFESPESIAAFQKEMSEAGVTWQLDIYSGAVHAFTNPQADARGIKGVAYNKVADERSWQAMTAFLRDVFGK